MIMTIYSKLGYLNLIWKIYCKNVFQFCKNKNIFSEFQFCFWKNMLFSKKTKLEWVKSAIFQKDKTHMDPMCLSEFILLTCIQCTFLTNFSFFRSVKNILFSVNIVYVICCIVPITDLAPSTCHTKIYG